MSCALTAFGATLGVSPASFVSTSQLKCASPAVAAPADAQLSLVPISFPAPFSDHLDARQSRPLPFTVYNASLRPLLHALEPRGVPLTTAARTAVRVIGADFGPDGVACSLGEVETAATF